MNVFISYAGSHSEFAKKLAQSLVQEGFEARLSGDELHTGSGWLKNLRDYVRTADGFILVMPETTASSSNTAFFEAGVARAFGKRVVVVVPDIDKVDGTNIPVDLAETVVIDAAKQSPESVAAKVRGSLETR